MNVLITISLIALLLTYLESIGRLKHGMAIGFVIVTIVASLRFDYGNDYMSYFYKFREITSSHHSIRDFFATSFNEQGWQILNLIFKPFGFFALVAFLTCINSIAYYRLIKEYVPDKWKVFALFIYLFSNSFFPMQLSMMRQALAMALLVLAVPMILKKQVWMPLLLLFLSATIHSSALMCVPVALILYFPFANGKLITLALVLLFGLFILQRDLIFNLMVETMDTSEVFEKYQTKYLEGTKYEVNTAMNIIGYVLFFIPVIISILFIWDKKTDENAKKLSAITVLGSFIILTGQLIPMVGRLAWFFTIFSIAAFPLAYRSIPGRYIRMTLVALFVLVTLREYFGFFSAENWSESFGDFHTIFSY